jgi:hypothetical protein
VDGPRLRSWSGILRPESKWLLRGSAKGRFADHQNRGASFGEYPGDTPNVRTPRAGNLIQAKINPAEPLQGERPGLEVHLEHQMNANVTSQQITRNSNSVSRNVSSYWDERRRWWAAEARRRGIDWDGVQESFRLAADHLASLRRRAASHRSPEAIVAQQPEPNAEVRGEYDALSGTFAEASWKADAERRNPRPRARRDSLPTSTAETIDWLSKYCDEQHLRNFLEGRSEAELERIERYIAWKKQQ